MRIETCHFGIHVHSLDAAKSFYVDKLGFEILQHVPAINLLAIKVGTVRVSIFADADVREISAAAK